MNLLRPSPSTRMLNQLSTLLVIGLPPTTNGMTAFMLTRAKIRISLTMGVGESTLVDQNLDGCGRSCAGVRLQRGNLEGSFRLKQRPRPSLNHATASGGHMLQVQVTLDLPYESGVKVVTGTVRDNGPKDRPAEEIEVSQ